REGGVAAVYAYRRNEVFWRDAKRWVVGPCSGVLEVGIAAAVGGVALTVVNAFVPPVRVKAISGVGGLGHRHRCLIAACHADRLDENVRRIDYRVIFATRVAREPLAVRIKQDTNVTVAVC